MINWLLICLCIGMVVGVKNHCTILADRVHATAECQNTSPPATTIVTTSPTTVLPTTVPPPPTTIVTTSPPTTFTCNPALNFNISLQYMFPLTLSDSQATIRFGFIIRFDSFNNSETQDFVFYNLTLNAFYSCAPASPGGNVIYALDPIRYNDVPANQFFPLQPTFQSGMILIYDSFSCPPPAVASVTTTSLQFFSGSVASTLPDTIVMMTVIILIDNTIVDGTMAINSQAGSFSYPLSCAPTIMT